MISRRVLLDIVCTEAIEHSGLQEVPDRSDGTAEYYHSPKRNARGDYEHGEQELLEGLPAIQYDLELIQVDDRLEWEE